MKKSVLLLSVMIIAATTAFAQDMNMSDHKIIHSGMHAMKQADDSRISLGLAPKQKQRQLANMRSHLKAVQDIIGLISAEQFNEASKVAHRQLGLTPEMKRMCNMFTNKDFKSLGLAFHQSADDLGEVLKSKNLNRSFQALHTTMNYCISCHATFRQ